MEFDLAEAHATEHESPADQHDTDEEPNFIELDMEAGRSQVLDLIEQQVLELLEGLANNRVPALCIVSHQGESGGKRSCRPKRQCNWRCGCRTSPGPRYS